MPLSPNYWTQAGIIVDFFRQQDKDLKGKKIVLVHIDTPFGKEPIPIFQALSQKLGYTFETFPYTPPGNDQAAIWPQVRRAKPDWVVFWGAGVGQTTALSEAIRNGIPMDRMSSSVWISESDMEVVGKDADQGRAQASSRAPAVAARRSSPTSSRRSPAKGRGAGPEGKIGTAYYNYGVDDGRHHGRKASASPRRKRRTVRSPGHGSTTGLTAITDFTAEGLLPPMTVTSEDHQGGGKGRIVALGWNEVRSADRLVLRESGRGVGGDQEIRRKLQDDRQVIRRRRAQS